MIVVIIYAIYGAVVSGVNKVVVELSVVFGVVVLLK